MQGGLSDHIRFVQRNSRYSISESLEALIYPFILGLGRIETTEPLHYNGVFHFLAGLAGYPDATTLRRFLDQFARRGRASFLRLHDRLLVVGNMGKYSRAVISSVDLLHDLAVLLIVEQPDNVIDKESSSGLELIDAYPQVGETVGYAGFPLGSQLLNSIHSPTYAEGVVGVQLKETPSRKDIQITGAVTGGYSSAPVVLKRDPSKLVGVLSSGPNPPESQGNIFMAVSWQHVEAIAKLAKS